LEAGLFQENSAFNRYIGIDYSGAQTADSSLKGLRVYQATGQSPPEEVQPPTGAGKYWSRRGIAEWLAVQLAENAPTLVGIDHGFSFPLRYFEAHQLTVDWPAFLDDFQKHWPTDGAQTSVEHVRKGSYGTGDARQGNALWRRLTEQQVGAKSVFHFDVPGSVAKSTHAGLPWLRYLRQQLGERLHFWPFDGWELPTGKSMIAEIYPSLWSKQTPQQDRTPDQHDAYVACAWLQKADQGGHLAEYLSPELSPEERAIANAEGWILGVR